MSDVGAWLERLGLGQLAALFRANLIDREVLVELTDGDLKELGLPLGARKKILKAIETPGDPPAEAGGRAAVG